jgi:hypothetical protein
MTAAERARRLDGAILDVRLALLNPAVRGERRVLLQDELDALRLLKVGVRRRGQVSILRRLGVEPPAARDAARGRGCYGPPS